MSMDGMRPRYAPWRPPRHYPAAVSRRRAGRRCEPCAGATVTAAPAFWRTGEVEGDIAPGELRGHTTGRTRSGIRGSASAYPLHGH